MRVSVVGDREGESFASPQDQRARIASVCERDGLELVDVYQALDVSGAKALADRPDLSQAVEDVEAGRAEVIAAAYFDRLFRSLSTQTEVIERVETAGGQVVAVDVGQVTAASAGQWLSSTMLGAVSEYVSRSARERSAEGQSRAVARGAVPWARVPLGYVRSDAGPLEVDPDTSRVALAERAFSMRDEGESIGAIRKMLGEHGVERSHRGVQVMLASRVYLGEIRFGENVNLDAHPAIIDRELWTRVQARVVPRGRKAPSDRLLARLGILRCGSCGSRLSTMKLPRQNDYPIYRCASTSDCARHVTISAVIAEEVVTSAVRQHLANAEGRASAQENAQRILRMRDTAQAELDSALRSFTAAGLVDEPAAVDRLAQLRAARDKAQAEVDGLGPQASELTINAAEDWDRLSLEGRRALIQATVESATVAPSGRGAERIDVALYG